MTTSSDKNSIILPYNWKPRDYQMPLWSALEGGVTRACVVWHRRAGKDLFAINRIACAAAERPGLYWHVLPTYAQGRKIVWNGMTRDGRPFLSYLPEALVDRVRDDEMTIWLKGGSIYQVVGADDVDRLVGANPVGVVLSEWSLHNPAVWNYLRPILAENGGWALFLYTPRGKNHGLELLEQAKKNDLSKGGRWYWQVLSVEDTNAITQDIIQQDRDEGMPDELIQQEYYCSFSAQMVGSYWGSLIQDARNAIPPRISNVPWDPARPVVTAWDLGIGDATAIWFCQQVGKEVRLIDYYQSEGQGLSHYAKILQEKPYVYQRHLVPHDATVRELGTGKSRLEVLRELGINSFPTAKLRVDDGIQAVRTLLPTCWFDETHSAQGLEHLEAYRKQWDPRRQMFLDQPVHDQASHAADAFRTLALGLRPLRTESREPLFARVAIV